MSSWDDPKDPDATLDYKFDWAGLTNGQTGATSDWLDTVNSEIITAITVTAPAGITVDSSAITDSGTSVTVWLSGGTHGQIYDIACKITTNNSTPRIDERTESLLVKHR